LKFKQPKSKRGRRVIALPTMAVERFAQAPSTVSWRIGHSAVSTTTNVYAHAFERSHASAAKAIEAALKKAQ
jgi:hypothetical protein